MRNQGQSSDGTLTLRTIAGSHVVMLGINMDERASEGVLGFGLQRTDHTNGRTDWIQGFKTFPGARARRGALVSTRQHPLQKFLWGDFTVRPGREYTYRVVAMRGRPGRLREGQSVEVRTGLESTDQGTHSVFFNRGVGGSQAYARKFQNRHPDRVPNGEAWTWLSRGLHEALLRFIAQAEDGRYGLRAAVYEFNRDDVLQAFAQANARGADVQVIFDDRRIEPTQTRRGKTSPSESNRRAIQNAGLGGICIPRAADPNAISHNKFIILLRDGIPVEVWTGSTNLTTGGIFGHSNVGHIVRDPVIAARYLEYWNRLRDDPPMGRRVTDDQIRPFNETSFPVPRDLPPAGSITPLFSPRRTLDTLRWYGRRMEAAQTAVFLTAAFGVNDLFEDVFAIDKDYLRYLLLEKADEDMARISADRDVRVAIGDVLGENAFERFLMEQTVPRLNVHVKYIHTKYMLIDPLGADPLVITGSANFSDASTRRNDENMVVIRGHQGVADIYLGEFMRLFNHFKFRNFVRADSGRTGGGAADGRHLRPDDSWRQPYYRANSVQEKEREYFAAA